MRGVKFGRQPGVCVKVDRYQAITPHMLYGELVGADGQPLPLLPNMEFTAVK